MFQADIEVGGGLQPPSALLKLAINSLGERAKFIHTGGALTHQCQPEMHVLQLAQLELIVSLQRLHPQADQVGYCLCVHAFYHKQVHAVLWFYTQQV